MLTTCRYLSNLVAELDRLRSIDSNSPANRSADLRFEALIVNVFELPSPFKVMSRTVMASDRIPESATEMSQGSIMANDLDKMSTTLNIMTSIGAIVHLFLQVLQRFFRICL